MTGPELLGVGCLGGVGAIARFLLDGTVSARFRGAFPLGTLAVNLTGAFVLGVLVGAAVDAVDAELLGTGLIGAFTTFSTWMLESQRLGRDRRGGLAAVNVVISLGLGLGLAWAGRHVGAAL